MALAPAAAVAVSLLLAHGPVLASGLERVPGAVATVLALPVVHAWWSAAQVVGLRRAQDIFPTPPLSWLNPGPDSWWYGGWVRRLRGMREVSPPWCSSY